MGTATTIKFGKCNFYCRTILLSLRRLLAKERKRKSAKERKNCKKPGLKQPGLGTPKFGKMAEQGQKRPESAAFQGGSPDTPCQSDKKKTNKHKHFRRDGVGDKQEPSLGQMGPLPGTEWDPSLGQTGLSLFNSTVKSPFCPVCPWDGWGFVPGTIVPQGPSEKCLCVFCLLVFCSQT